jgi:hypothetical protein
VYGPSDHDAEDPAGKSGDQEVLKTIVLEKSQSFFFNKPGKRQSACTSALHSVKYWSEILGLLICGLVRSVAVPDKWQQQQKQPVCCVSVVIHPT